MISLARLNARPERRPRPRRASSSSRASRTSTITQAVAAAGFYYAPDPSSAAGLHDRRQRRRELRRRALPQVRLHRQPRPRRRRRPARRRARLAVACGDDGPDLLGAFVGSEGTLGIAAARHAPGPACAGVRAHAARGFDTTDEAGAAVSGVIAAGILPAAIEMMDALTLEAVGGGGRRGYPSGCRRRADRRARRSRRPGRGGPRLAVEAICRECGSFARSASRPRRADGARAVWRGRKSASRRWAGSRRATTSRTASSRARSCPRCCGGSTRSREEYGLRVAQRLPRGRRQPAPARALRRARRGRGGAGRAARAPRFSTSASTPAARSPASTAWASTRRARCRSSSARRPRGDAAAARRVRPAGLANPGKCSRRRGSAARCPGRTAPHPLERAGLAERL